MSYNLSWILFLIIQCAFVILHPVRKQQGADIDNFSEQSPSADTSQQESLIQPQNDQVISVRITSSVAIGRTKEKTNNKNSSISVYKMSHETKVTPTTESLDTIELYNKKMTEVPPDLAGANIEFIKQLNAKKEAKEQNLDNLHPFELLIKNQRYNTNDEILKESTLLLEENDDEDNVENIPLARKVPSPLYGNHVSDKKVSSEQFNLNDSYRSKQNVQQKLNGENNISSIDIINKKMLLDTANVRRDITQNITSASDENKSDDLKISYEPIIEDVYNDNNHNQTDDSAAESSIKDVIEVTTKLIEDEDTPQAAISEQSFIHEFGTKSSKRRENGSRLTTVSFNIVHDDVKLPGNYNEDTTFSNPSLPIAEPLQTYEQSKIYSEPARIYSEPAKFYSEPAKIYSEPAKVYSEPAKVYSEPAKIYSEPAKFYSEPASLHLNDDGTQNFTPWQQFSPPPAVSPTTVSTTPAPIITNPSISENTQTKMEHQPEKNYEVEEKLSIISNGRSHGVQESSTEKCKQDSCKVGYVVEGRQYKKYRVEERTSDGFIVGEYGVVRNEDGALRGVRYTADSDASPRLIYDALMKFLQLR